MNMLPGSQLSTIFLGDLSVYCNERDLFELCQQFGQIESVQIKKCEDGSIPKPHLCYGFVRFHHRQVAETAMATLTGKLFLGRPLRVGWASNNPNDRNLMPQFQERKKPTAQVHVTYVCPAEIAPVTETKLREIFERFGPVLDVTINRADFTKDASAHSGYGFVHYELSPMGVSCAIRAIQQMNDNIVDFITFGCTVSHGLESYLRSSGQMSENALALLRPRASSHSELFSNFQIPTHREQSRPLLKSSRLEEPKFRLKNSMERPVTHLHHNFMNISPRNNFQHNKPYVNSTPTSVSHSFPSPSHSTGYNGYNIPNHFFPQEYQRSYPSELSSSSSTQFSSTTRHHAHSH